MPLELRPLQTSDALSWNRVRSLAYYGPTHDVLHKGPIRESSLRGLAEDRKREIGTPNIWHWKVVDTDLPPSEDDPADNGGRTIAAAVWKLLNTKDGSLNGYTKKGVIEEGQTEHASVPVEVEPAANGNHGSRYSSFIPPELRLDALMSLFNPLDASRDEIMGTEEPFFMLSSLATHPDYQGRGAGKLLLGWGLKKADDEGLVTYLDGTQFARPLYEKNGFEVKKAIEWDRTKWGGEGKDVHYCMVRQPKIGAKQ